jgi:hypothetical protein
MCDIRRLLFAAILGMAAMAGPNNVRAECTTLAFSVNDNGKEGPTRDAKALLDKHIADWAAKKGIKKYRSGAKDVECSLFLDFVIFDEYTCKAAAKVCW